MNATVAYLAMRVLSSAREASKNPKSVCSSAEAGPHVTETRAQQTETTLSVSARRTLFLDLLVLDLVFLVLLGQARN